MFCVMALAITLLIPEATSANSPTPLAEGFIRFENGAPVEYLVSGDSSQLPEVITLKSVETLLAASYAAMTPAARGNSGPVLLKKKFVSKRRLRRTGNLRRVGGSASTSSTGAYCDILHQCWDIRNILPDGRPWYVIPAYTVEGGPGPSTIRFTISTEVRNGFTTKLKLSNAMVSAEFGYNASSAWIATWENETPIPADHCRRVRTGSHYQDYKGDAFVSYDNGANWRYAGEVRSWKYDGFGFKVYEVPCS